MWLGSQIGRLHAGMDVFIMNIFAMDHLIIDEFSANGTNLLVEGCILMESEESYDNCW